MSALPAPTCRSPFRHAVRVYWEDTDAGGVVFYANYLKFFERARTEWLRALGLQQQQMRAAFGAIFVVSQTQTHYLAPARLDDLLDVTVTPTDCGRATLTLAQQAWHGPRLLCEGEIGIAWVDAETFKPRRMPEPLLHALRAACATTTDGASADRAVPT